MISTMKKIAVIAASLLLLGCMASCQKGPTTCVCTATVGGTTLTSEYTPGEGEKCSDAVVNIAGISYSCKTK